MSDADRILDALRRHLARCEASYRFHRAEVDYRGDSWHCEGLRVAHSAACVAVLRAALSEAEAAVTSE